MLGCKALTAGGGAGEAVDPRPHASAVAVRFSLGIWDGGGCGRGAVKGDGWSYGAEMG